MTLLAPGTIPKFGESRVRLYVHVTVLVARLGRLDPADIADYEWRVRTTTEWRKALSRTLTGGQLGEARRRLAGLDAQPMLEGGQ